MTVICFIWTSGDSETLDAPVTPSPDLASSNPGGYDKPTPGVVLGLRVVETLFFVVGVVYLVMVIRTFRVWCSIGAIPLRAGESEHPDVHDDVTSPPPTRNAPGETEQALRIVLGPEEGESNQCEVIVSEDEMRWEKERVRLLGSVSSQDNLPEVGEKTAYVGAVDFEPEKITEGSSDSEVLLRSTDGTSTPTSVLFGASTHD